MNDTAELRNELRAFSEEIKGELRALRSEIKGELSEVKEKQCSTDNTCSAQRQANRDRDREIAELKTAVKAGDQCRNCKNDNRLTKIETVINLMVWGLGLLATTTGGIMAKMVADHFSK